MSGKLWKGCDKQISLNIQLAKERELTENRNSTMMASDMVQGEVG
jgi:hypothetical protein